MNVADKDELIEILDENGNSKNILENRKFNEKFIDNSWFNVYVIHVNTENKKVHDMEVEENKFFTIDELKEKIKNYKDIAYKPEAFKAIIKYLENNN